MTVLSCHCSTAFKCAMMFKNLTGQPLKVLDIIPDLINHNPNQKVKEELDKKEINFKVRIFMI